MTTYESSEKVIYANVTKVFEQLSDIKKLDILKEKIGETQGIRNFEISDTTVSFDTDLAGKISLSLAEKIPNSAVKYTLKSMLKDADIQMNIKEMTENETSLKISIAADIPVMFKMMLGNKLSEGIEKLADGVAASLNATR